MSPSFCVCTTNKSTNFSRYGGIASNNDFSLRKIQGRQKESLFDLTKVIPGYKTFKPVHPNAVIRKAPALQGQIQQQEPVPTPPPVEPKEEGPIVQQEDESSENHSYKLVLRDGKYFLEG